MTTALKLLLAGMLLTAGAFGVVWAAVAMMPDTVDDGGVAQPPLAAVDSSGHGNDGINEGGPVVGLPGHQGTAYSFDAAGSWVQVRSDASLNPGTHDFLLSAWVNFTANPASGNSADILRKGLSFARTGDFKLEILDSGRVRCTAHDAGHKEAVVLAPAQRTVTDGRWHLVGCARTHGGWSVVVDDSLTTDRTRLRSISNDIPLSIGSKYGLEELPPGRMDDVRMVIAAERSGGSVADQVAHLQAAPPTGWWRLDETQPTEARSGHEQ